MRLALIGVLLCLSACTPPPAPTPSSTVIVLLRHAEKDSSSTNDPDLSATGQRRANQIAKALTPLQPDRLFSTTFKRTQQTLTPLSEQIGVPITPYLTDGGPLETQLRAFADSLRSYPVGQRIVVSGHSNTTPFLVNALTGADLQNLPEDAYGDLFTVILEPDSSYYMHSVVPLTEHVP